MRSFMHLTQHMVQRVGKGVRTRTGYGEYTLLNVFFLFIMYGHVSKQSPKIKTCARRFRARAYVCVCVRAVCWCACACMNLRLCACPSVRMHVRAHGRARGHTHECACFGGGWPRAAADSLCTKAKCSHSTVQCTVQYCK